MGTTKIILDLQNYKVEAMESGHPIIRPKELTRSHERMSVEDIKRGLEVINGSGYNRMIRGLAKG